MNSFRIKLSKGTILPFSFLLQLRLGNWKLCFLILSLHKKFYFLTLFTTPNSSIYPEWFHSGSEWIHSVLEWIHTVPEYIHSGSTFLIVSRYFFLKYDPQQPKVVQGEVRRRCWPLHLTKPRDLSILDILDILDILLVSETIQTINIYFRLPFWAENNRYLTW